MADQPTDSEMLERRAVDELPVDVLCRGCGRTITLWFNGGELDAESCCGFRYALEHGDIFLAVYDQTSSASSQPEPDTHG